MSITQRQDDCEFVCRDCWQNVDSFHSFYMKVQGIHRHSQLQSNGRDDTSEPSEFIVTELGGKDLKPIAVWFEPKVEIHDRPNIERGEAVTPLNQ